MLRKEIEQAINRNCAENGSDTPDFILAEYLTECLGAFDKAVTAREKWYGRKSDGGSTVVGVLLEVPHGPNPDANPPATS